jgi:integrase
MLSAIQRSTKTISFYEHEAVRLMAQFQDEHPGADQRELPIVQTTEWFLDSHGRWANGTVRLFALALEQELNCVLDYDTFDPDSREGHLLRRLKKDRPVSIEKIDKMTNEAEVTYQADVAAKKKKSSTKKRAKRRKSIPMRELRKIIKYFRSRDDEFSAWIVGYIEFATRLGWRPGEIIVLQREGSLIRAVAEKTTNGRGLTDFCEIDIAAYFEKAGLIRSASLASLIDRWIGDARKWEAYYGGPAELLENINERLNTASKNTKIRRACTYTFRHFAIACMKASGFSRAEIAVLVNHRSDRTAGEHYGRRQQGVKRPKKMLGFDPNRLLLVVNRARSFDRLAALEKKSAAEVPERLLEEAEASELETVSPFAI